MGILKQKLEEAVAAVRARSSVVPGVGVILGSGLGDLADEVENPLTIPFSDIPHFPVSTVEGHSGTLVLGTLGGRPVAVMRGRVHYYEGYTMQEVTFPTRLLRLLGCSVLVVTNASGGIREDLRPGDFCCITDHINLMGDNPLIGANEPDWGVRFPDMTGAYDRALVKVAHDAARKVGTELKEAVFCALTGPSYETRAEIRYLDRIGADLVGMSTVPEVIVATHMGMAVLGISCVMNVAHGAVQPVTHAEVLEVAQANRPRFLAFMKAVVDAVPAAVAR
jgi:purine-nucleoside phosphorylase